MTATPLAVEGRDHRLAGPAVLVVATLVAVLSARPYAGGWNDGSRLATVESLVDHHTLAIDDSIFVRVPAGNDASIPRPYPASETGLLQTGTGDKLFIRGRYYSDKSPVPALLLAGVYQGAQAGAGLKARERPDLFCFVMTLASSGLAYVASVWCVYRVGGLVGLSASVRLLLTASLAFCTVALTYSQHVNNHILLLGVTAALTLGFVRLAQDPAPRLTRLLILGTLAGLGYTLDLGAGPVLLV